MHSARVLKCGRRPTGPSLQGGQCFRDSLRILPGGSGETCSDGLVAEKYDLPFVLPCAARNHPRASSDSIIICPDDDRKCPYGEQWSELQRDDRIAAECASHPLPRNKFSLSCKQAVAAMAALPHSCLDHQRILMRRMQGRRSLLQIGPTSRTRDSVWFLFPCHDFEPAAYLSKFIPQSTSYF